MADTTYKLVRFCLREEHPDHHRVLARGLTLEEAQAHCMSPDTHGEDPERGVWFDGFESETPRDLAAIVAEVERDRALVAAAVAADMGRAA